MNDFDRNIYRILSEAVEEEQKPLLAHSAEQKASLCNEAVSLGYGIVKNGYSVLIADHKLHEIEELLSILHLFKKRSLDGEATAYISLTDELLKELRNTLKWLIKEEAPRSTNPFKIIDFNAKREALLFYGRFIYRLYLILKKVDGDLEGFEAFGKLLKTIG